MGELASFPYSALEFDKNGDIHDSRQLADTRDFVTDNGLTDLFVVSHGWNNNTEEAHTLYRRLFESARAVLDAGAVDGLAHRQLGVLGVLWPSKRFTDRELIPGGGAASANAGDESEEEITLLLDELEAALDNETASAELTKVREALSRIDNEASAREIFADTLRSLLPGNAATTDDGSDRFFSVSADELFRRLEAPIRIRRPAAESTGGATGAVGLNVGGAGGAAGLGDFFRGTRAAARRIVNCTTYYLMKARAGAVGARGVSTVVRYLREAKPELKIHLIGHSFGGRVVTAAAKSLAPIPAARPNTMTLLQAAFSHNGFAKSFDGQNDGFFRTVVDRGGVSGPILVTHTHNDKANAKAYPVASRVAGQDAAAVFGGPQDKFGAIGANGAQHTPEAISGTLLDEGDVGYLFEAGGVYNLKADKHITDHGDVHGREEAYAILSAVAVT